MDCTMASTLRIFGQNNNNHHHHHMLNIVKDLI
ncbi:hypothetical protein DERF_008341 [Dermatophagoides farinae]|uniref:Uncharacterized protein n=1 Tax=Dermatophagoides farinae TaxID=6954 RepID=A0A922I309_DERFA|nr:hypothetical protein DERF_008341 [Dermatophagoides farinae]